MEGQPMNDNGRTPTWYAPVAERGPDQFTFTKRSLVEVDPLPMLIT